MTSSHGFEEGSSEPDLKLIDGKRNRGRREIVPGFQLNKWAAPNRAYPLQFKSSKPTELR